MNKKVHPILTIEKTAAYFLLIIVIYAIFTMVSMPILGLPPDSTLECFELLHTNRESGQCM